MQTYTKKIYLRKISQLPDNEKPREKIVNFGIKRLTHIELISVLLGTGIKGKDVFYVARDLLRLLEKEFFCLSLNRIISIDGIGIAKACQILAAIELSMRFLQHDETKINSCEDVFKLVEDLKIKKQEHFYTITLDGAGCVIKKRTVFIGTLTQSLVHPREIFVHAISDRAASIIFIHNHPSGNYHPSRDDIEVTRRLIKAAKIIGIEVIDHIIVSKKGYFSFHFNGLLG